MNYTSLGLFVITVLLVMVLGQQVFAASSWMADNFYSHPSTTASRVSHPVCGTRLCKLGEKFNPRR